MIPAEMAAKERHKNAIAFTLVVIRPQPVESTIHGDVPRVAKPTRDNFKILSPVITPQHATIHPPIIRRVMVRVLIGTFVEGHGRRKIRHARRCGDAP